VKGRTFPYGKLPELKGVIEAQLAYAREVERRTGQIVPWVFHREGLQIKSFRTAWRAACRRTGIQRIPHDFRRTAARNMRRAGLSESDIMELCGWETRGCSSATPSRTNPRSRQPWRSWPLRHQIGRYSR